MASKLLHDAAVVIREAFCADGTSKGRGTFATKDFKAGELIFKSEPYVAGDDLVIRTFSFTVDASPLVLKPSEDGQRCSFCFRAKDEGIKLMRCSGVRLFNSKIIAVRTLNPFLVQEYLV